MTGEVRAWTGTSHSVICYQLVAALYITLLKLLPSDHKVSKSENCSFYKVYKFCILMSVHRYSITGGDAHCQLCQWCQWMDAGRRSQRTTMSAAIIRNKYKYSRKREPGRVQIFTQMTCKIKVGNLQKCNFIILKIKPPTSVTENCYPSALLTFTNYFCESIIENY